MIHYIFIIYTEKRSKIQIYDWVCLKMPCTRIHVPCFQIVDLSYTKSELLVIKRLLESIAAYHERKLYFDWTNWFESVSWLVLVASWFSIKILSLTSHFRFYTKKIMMKTIYVSNVEIQIEKTLLKAKAVIKENVKISKYLNSQ